MTVGLVDPDFFQVATYGDWIIGAECESGKIVIREFKNPTHLIHKLGPQYKKAFMNDCNSYLPVCTFNRVFIIMENYLFYTSLEDSLLIVDLDDGFKVRETFVELVCHFSIYRNIMCLVSADRTISKFKIRENAELLLIKASVVEKSKRYSFHTICRLV